MNAYDIYKKYYSLEEEEIELIKDLYKVIEDNIELFVSSLTAFYSTDDDLKNFFLKKIMLISLGQMLLTGWKDFLLRLLIMSMQVL